MSALLFAAYVVGVFAAMNYRAKRGYGPTTSLFLDMAWPLWMPVILFLNWRKARMTRTAGHEALGGYGGACAVVKPKSPKPNTPGEA